LNVKKELPTLIVSNSNRDFVKYKKVSKRDLLLKRFESLDAKMFSAKRISKKEALNEAKE